MAREDDFSKHSSRRWEDCDVFETSLRHRPVPCLTETKKVPSDERTVCHASLSVSFFALVSGQDFAM